MRSIAVVSGCFDFGLDERQFRCDDDPALCGDGLICDNGVCVVDDGQEICQNGDDDDDDGRIDCADVDCGQAACDDRNPCTVDLCVSDDMCENEPSIEGGCGIGCVCEPAGVAKEVICTDLIDNDQDELPDCLDPDCGTEMCAGGLQCCPDGGCRPTC